MKTPKGHAMNEDVMKTEFNTPEIPDRLQNIEAVDGVTDAMLDAACDAFIEAPGAFRKLAYPLQTSLRRDLRAALTAAIAQPLPSTTEDSSAVAQAGSLNWPNGCNWTAPAALRFLADNERPRGGEERYNAAHLYQIANELESAAKPRAVGVQDGWQDIRHLPEKITRFTAFTEQGEQVIVFRNRFGVNYDGQLHDDMSGLTHWMPLAAAPAPAKAGGA